jgi:dTDP-4-dehydrorhamnose reductase
MKKQILLVGSNGQIGTDLATQLPRLGEVIALSHQDLDLRNLGDIRRTVQELRPKWIINAAGYTAVDDAEKDEATARAVNAEAPDVLADEAARIGAVLVHYSTDYVFDGLKKRPYVEDDPTNPINVYGKTKLEGERAIQVSGAYHLIFRTQWVYSNHGRNFLLTVLRLATQRPELRIVADQIGSPTSSFAIAKATTEVLAQLKDQDAGALSVASGIYHMTAAGETSWNGFAEAILDEASRAHPKPAWLNAAMNGMPLIAGRVNAITTEEYPTPARRPAYSVLSNERLNKSFKIGLPSWREQLQAIYAAGRSD